MNGDGLLSKLLRYSLIVKQSCKPGFEHWIWIGSWRHWTFPEDTEHDREGIALCLTKRIGFGVVGPSRARPDIFIVKTSLHRSNAANALTHYVHFGYVNAVVSAYCSASVPLENFLFSTVQKWPLLTPPAWIPLKILPNRQQVQLFAAGRKWFVEILWWWLLWRAT